MVISGAFAKLVFFAGLRQLRSSRRCGSAVADDDDDADSVVSALSSD